MESDRRLSLIVGSFVIASLALTATAILLLSSGTGIFARTYRLVAHFDNIQGLLPGAPVWLAGKEVGRVSGIRFGDVGADRPVIVELRVEEAVQDRIRADSTASVQTVGLLGDSYVEITAGSIEVPQLEDGAEIYALGPSNLSEVVATGTRALENIATLAGNLNEVIQNFSSEDGESRVLEVVDSLAEISMEVQEGTGLLHSLIYDDYAGGGVDSIENSLATLEQLLGEVKRGDGILHRLIYADPSEQETLVAVSEASSRLNRILDKIDRGEGTIGLLINDPTLYADLKTLLGGAQRSAIVRSLIRLSVDEEE